MVSLPLLWFFRGNKLESITCWWSLHCFPWEGVMLVIIPSRYWGRPLGEGTHQLHLVPQQGAKAGKIHRDALLFWRSSAREGALMGLIDQIMCYLWWGRHQYVTMASTTGPKLSEATIKSEVSTNQGQMILSVAPSLVERAQARHWSKRRQPCRWGAEHKLGYCCGSHGRRQARRSKIRAREKSLNPCLFWGAFCMEALPVMMWMKCHSEKWSARAFLKPAKLPSLTAHLDSMKPSEYGELSWYPSQILLPRSKTKPQFLPLIKELKFVLHSWTKLAFILHHCATS